MEATSGPAAKLQTTEMPAPVCNAAAGSAISIDTLRVKFMALQSGQVAAQLVEKQVLKTGALMLENTLSCKSISAWLSELGLEIINFCSLYSAIKRTPLAYIGLLGEDLLRDIAAELQLDAAAPKDEVRGMVECELLLVGLEGYFDRLSQDKLHNMWAEWGLKPASTTFERWELIERLVAWVFDIIPEQQNESVVQPTSAEEMEAMPAEQMSAAREEQQLEHEFQPTSEQKEEEEEEEAEREVVPCTPRQMTSRKRSREASKRSKNATEQERGESEQEQSESESETLAASDKAERGTPHRRTAKRRRGNSSILADSLALKTTNPRG